MHEIQQYSFVFRFNRYINKLTMSPWAVFAGVVDSLVDKFPSSLLLTVPSYS